MLGPGRKPHPDDAHTLTAPSQMQGLPFSWSLLFVESSTDDSDQEREDQPLVSCFTLQNNDIYLPIHSRADDSYRIEKEEKLELSSTWTDSGESSVDVTGEEWSNNWRCHQVSSSTRRSEDERRVASSQLWWTTVATLDSYSLLTRFRA